MTDSTITRQQFANDFNDWAASHFEGKLNSIYRPMNVDKGCYIRLEFNKSFNSWDMLNDIRSRFGRNARKDSRYCIDITHIPRKNFILCRAGF